MPLCPLVSQFTRVANVSARSRLRSSTDQLVPYYRLYAVAARTFPTPRDAEMGCGIFVTLNIQKFCELCRGTDGHGRTNHVRRTMHILDVISSVI